MAKLNLDDLMDKEETPAEETKEVITEEETEEEKFNVGDTVYLLNYYEPMLLVHSLTVPDEDPTWVEVVWVNNNNEMVFSAVSMLCLTHTRPNEPAHNPPM